MAFPQYRQHGPWQTTSRSPHFSFLFIMVGRAHTYSAKPLHSAYSGCFFCSRANFLPTMRAVKRKYNERQSCGQEKCCCFQYMHFLFIFKDMFLKGRVFRKNKWWSLKWHFLLHQPFFGYPCVCTLLFLKVIQMQDMWYEPASALTLTLRRSPTQREKGSEELAFALNLRLRNPQGTVPD